MEYYILSDGQSFAAYYNSGAIYKAANVSDAQEFDSIEEARECLKEENKYLQGFSVYSVKISPV